MQIKKSVAAQQGSGLANKLGLWGQALKGGGVILRGKLWEGDNSTPRLVLFINPDGSLQRAQVEQSQERGSSVKFGVGFTQAEDGALTSLTICGVVLRVVLWQDVGGGKARDGKSDLPENNAFLDKPLPVGLIVRHLAELRAAGAAQVWKGYTHTPTAGGTSAGDEQGDAGEDDKDGEVVTPGAPASGTADMNSGRRDEDDIPF